MPALLLLGLAGVGLVVGFVSGLVGIGGGALIVPFLYFFYGHPEWVGIGLPPEVSVPVAHATSLFVIMPTAILGTIGYARAGLVSWSAVVPLGVSAMVAAVAGASIAVAIPAEALRFGFGAFLVVTGLHLYRGRQGKVSGPPRLGLRRTVPGGLAIGLLSALLGVGGGVVALPVLIHGVRIDMRRVAATSLAIVILAAGAGALTYAVTGAGIEGLPPGSVGYVHVVGALPILVGSLIAVRWGMLANQRLNEIVIRRIFAALFIVLGARLVFNAITIWLA